MKKKKTTRKQVGFLLDIQLLKQLKKEAIDKDMCFADYVRDILRNRKNQKIK